MGLILVNMCGIMKQATIKRIVPTEPTNSDKRIMLGITGL
jgi:hypothetical protein